MENKKGVVFSVLNFLSIVLLVRNLNVDKQVNSSPYEILYTSEIEDIIPVR
ncbi:hypothetical protein HNP65_001492 [Thermosipho japonicus]|uniref:Uncharacterized protein n=1 Tax=Thermosipho japonicus TaxID=90323 RepID=A0A841GT35_9BACT|nr:hypothetical protein [Thermosipho japonicus]